MSETTTSISFDRRGFLRLTALAGSTLLVPAVGSPVSAAVIPSENRPDHAKSRFLKSMNCSQAVLETYAPAMGLDVETSRRVAAAFAGGMGMGSECGAVTGAFMVIGLKYGKVKDKDPAADGSTFGALAELVQRFKAQHGAISCSALLGTDMGSPEGVKAADRAGLFTSRCPEFVRTVAQILEDILV